MTALLALVLAAHQGLTWDVPYPEQADGYRLYYRVPPNEGWQLACPVPMFYPRGLYDWADPTVAHVYPQKCITLDEYTPVEFTLRAYRGADESGNSNVVAVEWPMVLEIP